jgi:diaminohydroxyphosphoribosylaminopyrimidine deaminase/5-amino-6-(5-phosphoribosylamino)uracil reductase
MLRAIELASRGLGDVAPNPMVGCVIVCDGKVIGEGWHKSYGGPHAEVEAINSVKPEDQESICNSTCYVTLEPCAHYGLTPPCVDLLIENEVKKVVIAVKDPFAEVDGKGIQKLRGQGIEVEVGFYEQAARFVARRFLTFVEKDRPYVILKWAQTSDGFLAQKNYDSKWISNKVSRKLVHKWRSEEAAILVGKNTVKYDNPKLTVRDWSGKSPVRVVLDFKRDLGSHFDIFQSPPTTLLVHDERLSGIKMVSSICTTSDSIQQVLKELKRLKLNSLIVEGGAFTIKEFIRLNLWDEARVFTSKSQFYEGIEAPILSHKPSFQEDIKGDKLEITYNN